MPSVSNSVQKDGLVHLIPKGASVESIRNSRDKNNQYYHFFFLLFLSYITFYPFVLSVLSPVSKVLPVSCESLCKPKATLSAVSTLYLMTV